MSAVKLFLAGAGGLAVNSGMSDYRSGQKQLGLFEYFAGLMLLPFAIALNSDASRISAERLMYGLASAVTVYGTGTSMRKSLDAKERIPDYMPLLYGLGWLGLGYAVTLKQNHPWTAPLAMMSATAIAGFSLASGLDEKKGRPVRSIDRAGFMAGLLLIALAVGLKSDNT